MLLLSFAKTKLQHEGETSGEYPSLYFFTRSLLIEFIKNDQVAFEAGMTLNMGQLLSLPFIITGFGLIILTKMNPKYYSLTSS